MLSSFDEAFPDVKVRSRAASAFPLVPSLPNTTTFSLYPQENVRAPLSHFRDFVSNGRSGCSMLANIPSPLVAGTGSRFDVQPAIVARAVAIVKTCLFIIIVVG